MHELADRPQTTNYNHAGGPLVQVFYCVKEAIQGDPEELKEKGGFVAAGLGKYYNNFATDNLHIWALWIPGDTIVYALRRLSVSVSS